MERVTEGATRRAAALGTSLCLTLAACGGSNTGADAFVLGPDDPAAMRALLDSPLTAPAPDGTSPEGRWAQLQITTARSRAPMIGEVVTTNQRLVLLDIAAATDGTLSVEGTVCDMDISTSTSMADTVVPPALITAMPALRWTGNLVDDTPVFERSYELLGLSESVSSHATSDGVAVEDTALDIEAAAIDPDGDGNPGVTIQVTGMAGGEMYFGQRSWRDMVVERSDGLVLDGHIVWGSDRVLYGATSRSLRNADPAVPSDDPAENWFRSTRVRADASCDEVREATEVLFGR